MKSIEPMKRILPAFTIALLIPVGVSAQDGPSIIQKMEATYRGLNSYSQKMNATGQVRIGNTARMVGMTSELKVVRPAKAFVVVSTPSIGSIISFCNGKEQVAYLTSPNVFQKMPAPTDFKGFVDNLFRFGVVSALDPLYYISGEKTASNVSSIKLVGEQKLETAMCDVVEGALTPGRLKGKAASGTVKFWIDRKTSLLRKLEITLKSVPTAANVATKQGEKPTRKIVNADHIQTITILELQVNPSLNDGDFNYSIPKGAIEQKR